MSNEKTKQHSTGRLRSMMVDQRGPISDCHNDDGLIDQELKITRGYDVFRGL
jgi:hypothetical protein